MIVFYKCLDIPFLNLWGLPGIMRLGERIHAEITPIVLNKQGILSMLSVYQSLNLIFNKDIAVFL